MKVQQRQSPTVAADAVREQLGKVLSSVLFQNSERSSRLLRFLVEQTLKGQTDHLKEYTLATEALGKGTTFDPRTDPIVRAEASRLRTRLEKYYTTEGGVDDILIELPKGSYVPKFETRVDLPRDQSRTVEKQRWAPKRTIGFALGLAVLSCVILATLWNLRPSQPSDGPISIAVLPFANMSGDTAQEFFSDGITEEITSALAKVPDLRVVARTSAFEFKGERRNVKDIGQQLHATHLIEGSVRKAGDRVRITAQLIRADDGTHIWSEDYDRNLTDIFAIQEDIARSIVTSLRMPLGLNPGENLVANRNIDPELYQQFLRLRAQFRTFGTVGTAREVLPEFEKLVARDPNFAPAWAYLSRLYIRVQAPLPRTIWSRPPEETRRLLQPAIDKAEKAAREAIRLDPRQSFAYAGLAFIEERRKNWAAAADLHRKALELDPYDPDVLEAYGAFLFEAGRVKDSLRVRQQVLELEPVAFAPEIYLAMSLLGHNQPDAVITMFQTRPPRQAGASATLALAYAMVGRFNDSAEQVLRINNDTFGSTGTPAEAARLIRSAPAKVKDPSALPPFYFWLDWVYGYVGAPERLLDYPERALQADISVDWFLPSYAPVRKTERFKTLVRKAGLVDYWKARGWPDMCHPTTGDDFECE